MTKAVVAGEGRPAGTAGRRAGARRRTLGVLLAAVLAFGVALGGGALADLDQSRTLRALHRARSENGALRARQEALLERTLDLEERLAGSVERVRRPAAVSLAGR